MGRARTRGLGFLAAAVAVACAPAAVVAAPGPNAPADVGDPPFSVDLETLDAALDCDPFAHPDTEPVLLVHGTTVGGHEQWDWNYAPFLRSTGRDVCIVTYPDRGLGDMQISAEYVARALQRIRAESGRSVDMVGHSQGALMPRWALKFWPSARDAVDDFVLLAGPHHGVALASRLPDTDIPRPAVTFQFAAESQFLTTLNAGDETPGDIDYTSIYTLLDEVVQPVDPPTAALAGADDANVVNIAVQDLCPARIVDHVTIGTTDALTMQLVVDALAHDGPADPSRIAVDSMCAVPDQYVAPEALVTLLRQLPDTLRRGLPELHLVTEEPPLRSYAVPDADGSDPGAAVEPTDDGDAAEDPPDEDVDADPAASGDDVGDESSADAPTSGEAPRRGSPTPTPDDADPSVDPDDEIASDAVGAVTAASEPGGISLFARTGAALPLVAAAIAATVAMVLRLGSSHRYRD